MKPIATKKMSTALVFQDRIWLMCRGRVTAACQWNVVIDTSDSQVSVLHQQIPFTIMWHWVEEVNS